MTNDKIKFFSSGNILIRDMYEQRIERYIEFFITSWRAKMYVSPTEKD